jgi:hypothetical protein
MGRDEMKVDVWVAGQPAIVFGFVSVEIVEDDVQFAVRIRGHEAVHKMQKFNPPPVTSPVATSRAANNVVVPCRL